MCQIFTKVMLPQLTCSPNEYWGRPHRLDRAQIHTPLLFQLENVTASTTKIASWNVRREERLVSQLTTWGLPSHIHGHPYCESSIDIRPPALKSGRFPAISQTQAISFWIMLRQVATFDKILHSKDCCVAHMHKIHNFFQAWSCSTKKMNSKEQAITSLVLKFWKLWALIPVKIRLPWIF